MEITVENWRVALPSLKDSFKAARNKLTGKKVEPERECVDAESPCCVTCRYVKSKTCGSDDKKLRCQKEPPLVIPSYSALSRSVSGDSKYCCCALGLFLKEVGRAVHGDPDARISETLSELAEAMLAIANDCVLFLGRIGCGTVTTVKTRTRQYAQLAHAKMCALVARSRRETALAADKMKAQLIKVIQESVVEPKFPEFGAGEPGTPRRPKRTKSIPKRMTKKKQPKNWKSQNYRL